MDRGLPHAQPLPHRAEHLHVLNDLARRLASLRGSREVLQEITFQARRLLEVDVAYIMLLTDGAVLRIELVDGSIGSALRGIELESGQGLGGRVLATGQALWSANYLADAGLDHVPSSDEAVTSEHIVGVLGVPLVTGDETIGVLLAADRRIREFEPEEILLLAALASHAAAAIHNASLFEQYEAVTRDLRAVNEMLRAANAARQRAAELRERLTATVIAGGGISELVRTVERALGSPVAYFAEDGQLLAGEVGAASLAEATDGLAVGDLFADASLQPREVTSSRGRFLAAPVLLPTGPVGCLVSRSGQLPDEESSRFLATGATSVALVVASERSVIEAELRVRGEFVHTLLSSDLDEPSVRRRARATGIDLDALRVVAVIEPVGDDTADASRVARRLAQDLQGWSAEHNHRLVVLIPHADADTVRDRLSMISDQLPGPVGLAATAGGVAALRASYDAAAMTATVLHALGRVHHCGVDHELGPYRVLFGAAGRHQLASFVEATIGNLRRTDTARNRELARTAEVYLDLAQHHARTCTSLHIHANTLYQRLERLSELLGEDWRRGGRATDIHLALRLDRLARKLEP